MRGVIHAHSYHSHDSLVRIDKLIDRAVEEELDFFILTDHDTINGSLELRRRLAERGIHLIAPIAAEYKTEYGDIIAAFITREVKEREFSKFVAEVKRQGGLLMLPHAYEAHPLDHIAEIVKPMDLIEVFNSRCTDAQDLNCSNLATEYNKLVFFGSDSHLESELCNVTVEIDGECSEEGVKHAITYNEMRIFKGEKISIRNLRFSQLIKAVKKKRLGVFYRNIVAILIDAFRLGWQKRVG